MRRTGLLIPLLVTGCTQGSPAPPPSAPADGAPVLQLTSRCYGECSSVEPLGLPDVVVYADGVVVRVNRAVAAPTATLATGKVGDEELAELLDLARDADLEDGASETLGFREVGFADGSGDVLTARIGGGTTTVESPQSYDAQLDRYSTDPERREALRTLGRALRSLETSGPYAAPGLVVRATPRGPGAGDAARWPGPPLASLPEDGDGRCGVVSGVQAEEVQAAVADDGFPTAYADAGVAWLVEARPLLPHEDDCADVQQTVSTSRGPDGE